MKLKFFYALVLSSLNSLASTGDYIIKDEYEFGPFLWVTFKKNYDELFVTKAYQGSLEPFYFAFSPKTGTIFSSELAEKWWDALDIYYEKIHTNEAPK